MGIELSLLFVIVPSLLIGLDVVRLILGRDVVIHLILLLLGLLMLGSLMLNSYLDGFHPQQGLIIGSVYYLPAYVLTWGILFAINARITQHKFNNTD